MVNKRVKAFFEQVENYDDRFYNVKIWLMHLGRNYNKSIFTKESVINAMDTLKNTPILGFIEESKSGELDFRGHESELTVEDGKLKVKYIGSSYGVIPETCNPRFEKKTGDFGEELEYLVVDGLLWRKFDDAINIIENRDGEVAESMELGKEYEGYSDDEGNFVFTKFQFDGACMLGADVLPAMEKASVEKDFSFNIDVFQEEISKKLEEFNLRFSKNNSKEVENVGIEELLAKYSISTEDLTSKGIDVKNFSIEELEEKIKEVFTSEEPKGATVVDELKGNEAKNYVREYSLSHEDIRVSIYDRLDDFVVEKQIGEKWDFWITQVFDNNFIAQNEESRKLYKISYTSDNNTVSLGDYVEVFASYLTSEEKGALELMRSNYAQLETENTSLKEFKKTAIDAQHVAEAEELFGKFDKLTEEDLTVLRENIHNFSIEDIESKLYEILGRKTATFSTTKKPESTKLKINLPDDHNKNRYSSVFEKHGIVK